MSNTSELKNKLDNLYDALLENSESNVKNEFKKVRDALVNAYLVDANKNTDGTFTDQSAESFGILQGAVVSAVVPADSDQRIWATSFMIKLIKRFRELLNGEGRVVEEFLKKIRQHVNETKFYKNIRLDTYKVDENGQIEIEAGNNQNLRYLIAHCDSQARSMSSKIRALPPYAGMELTDREKRLAE